MKGGDAMDMHARLQQLLKERGWTEYRLSKECGLAQSTIGNIFRRNTVPSVSTLEVICRGFGITLSQFFAEGELVELTREQQEMFSAWSSLSRDQKEVLAQLIRVMKQSNA